MRTLVAGMAAVAFALASVGTALSVISASTIHGKHCVTLHRHHTLVCR